MSRRIDIELTSELADGIWTWRAAGARQPKGVVSASLLPGHSKVGDQLRVDVEQEVDGITVLAIVNVRVKQGRSLVELLPSERVFAPVVEQRAARAERGERGDRKGYGDRKKRGERGDRKDHGDREQRGEGADRNSRGNAAGSKSSDRSRRGPSFAPPPEIELRPKAKRLRPGNTHRTEALASLAEELRPIAELALQGLGAVRQRVRDENAKAVAAGLPPMPETSVVKMAEDLLPRLRVAEWRDRAEAAIRQLEHLDLRDLRSVVVASSDPIVARDESTRSLATDLKLALVNKQEQELVLWYGDIDSALAVGRVIRALRLSSQPPKAGVPFPTEIAQRLADSTNASLSPLDTPDRWSAMLEAIAFSPIRALIKPARKPDAVNDDLLATVKRLSAAIPYIAGLFDIVVPANASMPKPLRAGPPGRPAKAEDKGAPSGRERPGRGPKRSSAGAAAATQEPKPEAIIAEPIVDEAVVAPELVVAPEPVDAEPVDDQDVAPEPVVDGESASTISDD